ncbi:MAG: DUF3106 domain-containing protein [Dokdonella sp.]
MMFFRGAGDAAAVAAVALILPLANAAEPPPAAATHAPAAAPRPVQTKSAGNKGAQPPATRPPGSRGTMLPLVQPLWSELDAVQQDVLAPFASQWNAWPAAEKQSWLALAGRVPKMECEDEARTRERISEWAALTPDQRRVARQNYRLARQLPPDERKAQWERYTQLTPEQRAVLRSSGWTSNTAARHAGAPTGLAKDAAQPFAPRPVRIRNPQ